MISKLQSAMKSYFWPLVEDVEVEDSVLDDDETATVISDTGGKGKVKLEKSYGEGMVAYSILFDEEKATEMAVTDRKGNVELEKADEERKWLDLPVDIISQILSGLPIESLIRCRFVCKSWYTLTKDPCFIELQLSKAMCQPHRLILSGYVDVPSPATYCRLFSVDRGRFKWKARRILKEISGYILKIEGSCNGLLCVASCSYYDDIKIFICNPITSECIRLPKSKLPRSKLKLRYSIKGQIGFAFDPTCTNYKVLRLNEIWTSNDETMCMGEIITLGESSWREINIPCREVCSRVVFSDGALHWLIRDSNSYFPEQILVFNISSETFRVITLPPPIKQLMVRMNLIKFGKSLAIVEFSYNLMHIWKIVGNMTKGYFLYKYYYDISLMKDDFYMLNGLELVGMLDNDSFLLDVLRGTGYSSEEERYLSEQGGNLLLLYFPAKKEYFHVGISGIRRWDDVASFVPSLVSPRAVVAAVNGGSQRGI